MTPNVGNKRQPKAVRLIDGLGVTVAQARQPRNAKTPHERRQESLLAPTGLDVHTGARTFVLLI